MDKGIETLCTFFGVLYSGACYSLINPEFPEARINQIKEVLNSKKVITNKENLEKIHNKIQEVIKTGKLLELTEVLNLAYEG